MPSRPQITCLIVLAVVALVLALMPHCDAPHFRYTGSDPNHLVWNLGWPIATCIYDTTNSPHFFVGPFGYVYNVMGVAGFTLLYGVLVAWNNRRGLLRNFTEMEAADADRTTWFLS